MNCKDDDMMEAEATAPPPAPSPAAASSADPNDIKNLLTMARQLVDQGQPSQALQANNFLTGGLVSNNYLPKMLLCTLAWHEHERVALTYKVVMAMKIQGGDEAVSQALNRAQELYRNKVRASAAADELASLFAECAIAEAIPGLSQHKINDRPTEPDPQGTSILAETGRKQVVLDAFSDGSSFVCLQCGGLVSNHRKEEHFAFWCCKT
ncbi:hypothetical protein DH2020_004041 [Rehmannia glutinosa]|uniref:C2HC zinc finger plants domain-containing protein n=1 Tax=Rehmannia glutinosa TaxID=99300 RepID=A0ABR0XNC7_REHGL